MLCLKPSVTRRHRRLQSWFWCRLNRESLIFQTTPQSAPEEFTSSSYGSKQQNVPNHAKKLENAGKSHVKIEKLRLSGCRAPRKRVHNSGWSTPPDLIFDSFESQESHQLNEAGVSSWLNDPEGYCHWFRRSEKKKLIKNLPGFSGSPRHNPSCSFFISMSYSTYWIGESLYLKRVAKSTIRKIEFSKRVTAVE